MVGVNVSNSSKDVEENNKLNEENNTLTKQRKVKISVRDLVEFVMRSGDIDTSSSGVREVEAMKKGTKLHQKVQKSMATNYNPETQLKEEVEVVKDDITFTISIEGRADGVILPEESEYYNKSYIDIVRDNYIDRVDDETACDVFGEYIDGYTVESYGESARACLDEKNDIGKIKRYEELRRKSALGDNYIVEDRKNVIIHEIKGVLRDIHKIHEPVKEHRAQAMVYAYIWAKRHNEEIISIRVSYYNLESEQVKHFGERFTYAYLNEWFETLIEEYTKWGYYQAKWEEKRNASLKKLEFPFEYREGQKDLVAGVYRTIIRDKKLYLEAPTGVGKTISTVFPAVKAMGEEQVEKIFYLTAKTITRTAAENAFRIIKNYESCKEKYVDEERYREVDDVVQEENEVVNQNLIEINEKFDKSISKKAEGTHIKYVTITAKEKICVLDKVSCNPVDCPRAKGHFDRINDAVFDLINNECDITREVINEYAKKYNVCPFEMCLDVSLWVDAVICDYNYAFDPNVYLRRFFEGDVKHDYVFLVDEAHNLVERACEMFSAELAKEDFLTVKKLIPMYSKKLITSLEACNKEMLKFKRTCEECEVFEDLGDAGGLVVLLMRVITRIDEFTKEYPNFEHKETLLDLYFDMRHFVNIYELIDDDYLIYTYYDEQEKFKIQLRCMNPSRNLSYQLKKGKSAIFFSATLLPVQYYMNQLSAKEDDYAVYAPSTFDKSKRNIMIARDVSTKYTRRNDSEYKKIARYIEKFINGKVGNYMVFFPSYSFMEKVYDMLESYMYDLVVMQDVSMSEEEREEFLDRFEAGTSQTKVGFCVLGGIFSEGIDLKNDRLIGAVIVGTGLPMVCTEREIYRGYYDRVSNSGFEYAYLYTGMNKVLQAAGRVIRTAEDVGQILLLDERLLTKQYQNIFPREWFPFEVVDIDNVEECIMRFWKK